MKKQTQKRQTFSNKILHELAEDIDQSFRLHQRGRIGGLPYAEIIAVENAKERRVRTKALKRLAERKLIEIKNRKKVLMAQLTPQGKLTLLIDAARRTKKFLPNNEMCCVTYDIPVAADEVRRTLRRLLRTCGFVRVHGSVWVTRLDVVNCLVTFLRMTHSQHWIHVLVGRPMM